MVKSKRYLGFNGQELTCCIEPNCSVTKMDRSFWSRKLRMSLKLNFNCSQTPTARPHRSLEQCPRSRIWKTVSNAQMTVWKHILAWSKKCDSRATHSTLNPITSDCVRVWCQWMFLKGNLRPYFLSDQNCLLYEPTSVYPLVSSWMIRTDKTKIL